MGILDGKIAIVTGAGKGLGRSEALALAKEGASVTVLARTPADVQSTAEAIEGVGAKALPICCDVRDRGQVDEVVRATVEQYGTVDILVNNAQIMYPDHPLEEWTDEEMRASWESGFMGSWYFMRACFPYMKKQRSGRIVNTTSAAGHGAINGFVGYSTAKEAIRTLSRCAAREWGQHNINVNVISPMAMSPAAQEFWNTPEKKEQLFDTLGSALRRFGDPDKDVARTVVFLTGPDSTHITGCTISIDGGSAMI